jgi:serine protease
MRSYRLLLLGLTLVPILNQFEFCSGYEFLAEKDPHDDSAAFFTASFSEKESEMEHRYIVKFKDSQNFHMATKEATQIGIHIMGLPLENSEVMTLGTIEDVQHYEERDDVEFVERDHKLYLQSENIPYGIDMVNALEVTDDSVSNQKVCIIDTGYEIGHPDLPSASQIVSGSSRESGDWSTDGNGHGTHVAGTIAAIGDNEVGVVGVNRNGALRLHIVKVFGASGGWIWGSTLIAAADECVENDSTIISMSLGGPSYSNAEESAFNRMYNEKNILIVAAAGNDGSTSKSYPASYSSVISVGAINRTKQLATFSQRNDQVDLVAPGVDIKSTFPGGIYQELSGTSMATPHVSGVAALVWSHFPEKTAQEIRKALEDSAVDLGNPGRDNSFGHGLVDAKDAFDLLSADDQSPGEPSSESSSAPSNESSSAPSSEPSSEPSVDDDRTTCVATCSDSPLRWHDSDGSTFNCYWYSKGEFVCY